MASLGLLRVIGRSSTPAASDAAVSLTLGASGKPAAEPKPVTSDSTTQPAPTPAPVAVTSPVAILNASSVRGLASRTAALLRKQGVVVAAVDNLTGGQKPDVRTVFYPPGEQAQAQALADLSGTSQVAPAPGWIPADGRLVLVLTEPSTTSASGPLSRS